MALRRDAPDDGAVSWVFAGVVRGEGIRRERGGAQFSGQDLGSAEGRVNDALDASGGWKARRAKWDEL